MRDCPQYGEFVNLTEEDLSSYKAKDGLSFTAHFIVVQKKVHHYIDEISGNNTESIVSQNI